MSVEVILGGVVIVVVVAYVYYRTYLRRRAAALAGSCGLFTDWVFPDECLGLCTPPQTCTVLTTRSYFGGLGTQAAACGCRVPPPPAGGAGGGGAVPSGGTLPGEIAPVGESTTTGH